MGFAPITIKPARLPRLALGGAGIVSALFAMPAMAAKLSWNETLDSAAGSMATMTVAARASAGSMLRGRPTASSPR